MPSKDTLCYVGLALTQRCDDLPQTLIHASLKGKVLFMRKGRALNAPNNLFLSNEDQSNNYPLWDNEHLKSKAYTNQKFFKTDIVYLLCIFLLLFFNKTFWIYSFKNRKALKTPWTFWEKRAKCLDSSCVCKEILH